LRTDPRSDFGGADLSVFHPSYLLRIQSDENQAKKADAYNRFLKDLRVCAKALHDSKQNPALRRTRGAKMRT